MGLTAHSKIFVHTFIFLASSLALSSLASCSKKTTYKENDTMNIRESTPRINKIFQETKLVCFGRYALVIPKEAKLIWGSTYFPSKVTSISGNKDDLKATAAKEIDKIKYSDAKSEIIYNDTGPVDSSWQIRYFDSPAAKQLNLLFFTTFISKSNRIFILGNAIEEGQSQADVTALETGRSKSLTPRPEDITPPEEGYCIQHGFMLSSFYQDQEIVNVGIYIPSLPDVTFSISSNKDAYADYSIEAFAKKKVDDLPLLARIRKAQEEQGSNYPQRTVLREGKRAVQHWQGEESLIKRPDGVHDFEWGFVGTPKDVANPSEIIINMYTKVEHNVVGAAKIASVSDDEALALWDTLLSGLKFRVRVPGAPVGAYFLPADKKVRQAPIHQPPTHQP
jgi:hypothetical protein